MKHDESALVKQALRDAGEQLAKNGQLMPTAYMLVRNNPQTGAPLTNPTALAWQRDTPFASQAEYDDFLEQLRAEITRLAAIAVAIGGEAQAEVESGGKLATRRVFMLRVEDRDGVEQLHAPIEADDHGELRLGKLLADAGAEDILVRRLFS